MLLLGENFERREQMETQEKTSVRGVATRIQMEKRLTSIALGRQKKPEPAKISEQLKAMELLMKLLGEGGQNGEQEPTEIRIRVIDEKGKALEIHGV